VSPSGPNSLEQELGGAPPRAVSRLPADQQEDLAAAIRDARRRQAKALAVAAEQALNLIPRVLRGPVRKLFS
jgi:hypothetical protein